ncbi:tRNA threonylcarbamoyladenosine dehydratase [Clostridia bacterium]|nr:tRNA threonylcarbamoyladenosine dehydratase [Clostridia bacterium]
MNQFSRTELLFGRTGMERLAAARVAVFGIGGVGGYTAEALARSGVGALDLFDDDRICITNLNRQIFATRKTVGQYKTEAAAARLLEINPDLKITEHRLFYTPKNADTVDLAVYGSIADAVDTVSAKIELVLRAQAANVPIVSCMGAGNKLDASAFRADDIYNTSVCPLAKVMRSELRKRGVKALRVVYSREEPLKPIEDGELNCKNHCVCPPETKRTCAARRQIPGSNAYVPAAAGLIMAGEIVSNMLKSVDRGRTEWYNTAYVSDNISRRVGV